MVKVLTPSYTAGGAELVLELRWFSSKAQTSPRSAVRS